MNIVHGLINLYIWVLIIAALLSWFPIANPSGGLAATRRVLGAITEPVLRPIRQILPRPRVGGVGIDFSVLVAVILLEVVNRFI
jgi:YggT family protein